MYGRRAADVPKARTRVAVQDCFGACQEMDLDGGDDAASEEDGDGSCPAALGQGQGGEGSCPAALGQGQGGEDMEEPSGNAASEDRAVFAWAFGPLREGAAANLLGLMDDNLFDELRKDFKEARQRLLARAEAKNGGPDRTARFRASQQVRNSLSVRVAIGAAYNEHKRQALEQGDRHYVKSFVNKTFTCAYSLNVGQRVMRCGKLVESGRAIFKGEHGQDSSGY